jgi:uncharacterized membrane protein
VVFWSGLRGAVSTALALSLPTDFPDRAQLQAITFGVVLFTMVVQATTAELVVGRWGGKASGSSTSKPKPKSGSKSKSSGGDPTGGRPVDGARLAADRAGSEADGGLAT